MSDLICPVCGRPLEEPETKLDSDLWRARFALRVVAGLSAATAALAFTEGQYWQGAVSIAVALLASASTVTIMAHQRTRDAAMKARDACLAALKKIEDLQ
jgi:hypothetical protein